MLALTFVARQFDALVEGEFARVVRDVELGKQH